MPRRSFGAGETILNRTECARLFGCTLPTIDNWIAKGLPAVNDGRSWSINSVEAYKWLVEREREDAVRCAPKSDESDSRRRKLAAEASQAELDYAIASGQALGLAEWEAGMAAMVGAARARLLGLGAKLGPVVAVENDPMVCRDLIDASVAEALIELADGKLPDDGFGEVETSDGDVSRIEDLVASAEADSQ